MKCECADQNCAANHPTICKHTAALVLIRIDKLDAVGTRRCEDCAADAMGTGMYRVQSLITEASTVAAVQHGAGRGSAKGGRLSTKEAR